MQAYSGDTVELSPSVTAESSPDTSWVWTAGKHQDSLTVRTNCSAVFQVPAASAGTAYNLSVSCTGDRRLSVPERVWEVVRAAPGCGLVLLGEDTRHALFGYAVRATGYLLTLWTPRT